MNTLSPEIQSAEVIYAVDLGGSKVMTALVEGEAVVRHPHRLDPAPTDPDQLLQVVVDQYNRLAAQSEFRPVRCGIAIPGLTDPVRGVWRHAAFSGIRDWPVRDVVEQALGIPVFVANDVDACALAERFWGGGRTEPDFLWVTLSNGVGGAIVLNGRLYRGPGFAAGELGHMKAVRDGAPCECGGAGCLEQYGSGRAISRHYRELSGIEGDSVPAKDIAEKARQGDSAAREAYAVAARHLGNVLADAISLLNVPCVFLGGGVAGAFDLMEPSLMESLEKNLYPEANTMPRVLVTRLGYEAALLGAAAIAHPFVRENCL